jgi:hypothetical protein
VKTSDQVTNVYAAIAKAQGALTAAVKDSTNPAFRSKYADLTSHVEAIRPTAKANDLAILQELTSDSAGVAVTTRIVHKSGEWVEFGPLFIPATKHDAQGFGSACSYARRYALSAAFGTVADDDDGNAAVQSTAKRDDTPTPIGYDDWLTDMQALASSVPDVRVFRDSYKASHSKYRHHLETTDKPTLDKMVETAKANEAALVGAAKGQVNG